MGKEKAAKRLADGDDADGGDKKRRRGRSAAGDGDAVRACCHVAVDPPAENEFRRVPTSQSRAGVSRAMCRFT